MLIFYCLILDTEQERKKMTEIYEEHKHALMMYAVKISTNKEIAEDAVHNAFLAVITKKEEYFILSSREFRALAVIIVRNKCIDLLRQQKQYTKMPFEDLEIFIEAGGASVEEQAVKSSEYELIRKHLNSIDEISRQILIMKYFYGMTYKEIGERLGMTPKHVDTRIMKAKDKVWRLIGKEMGVDE